MAVPGLRGGYEVARELPQASSKRSRHQQRPMHHAVNTHFDTKFRNLAIMSSTLSSDVDQSTAALIAEAARLHSLILSEELKQSPLVNARLTTLHEACASFVRGIYPSMYHVTAAS